MLLPESVPAYCCRQADLSRAFVPDGFRFVTVDLWERRNAVRLLRPTAPPLGSKGGPSALGLVPKTLVQLRAIPWKVAHLQECQKLV
jgi:hypothetical protein